MRLPKKRECSIGGGERFLGCVEERWQVEEKNLCEFVGWCIRAIFSGSDERGESRQLGAKLFNIYLAAK